MSKNYGVILVFLGGICWGFSGVCGEFIFLKKGLNADFLVPLRLLFAGILMLLFCLIRKIKINFLIFKNTKHLFTLLIFSFFGIFMCQYTYFYGIELSNAAIATVIQYTAPVFIVLIVCFEQKRFPNIYEILALICVLCGAFLLSTNGDFNKFVISTKALIVCFLSSIGAVCYAIIPRKINMIYSPLPNLGFAMIIAGIAFCLYQKIWEFEVQIDLELILAMLGVIVVGTTMAFGFFMVGLQEIGASKASLISSNEPLAAAIIGYLWLGTSLLIVQIIGFALIMIGILITMLKKEKS